MPGIGPNFTEVRVGLDANKKPAIFIDGKTADDPHATASIDFTWASASEAAQLAAKPHAATTLPQVSAHTLKTFKPNGGIDWTATIPTGVRPKVGDWVLVTGRVTMKPDADCPPFIFWAQTLKVKKK